jgi:hypothetical protein
MFYEDCLVMRMNEKLFAICLERLKNVKTPMHVLTYCEVLYSHQRLLS